MIDLDVVSVEVVGAIAFKLFPQTIPRRIGLKLPVRCDEGDNIIAEFYVVSEFGTRELSLATIVKSERQLVQALLLMIEHGLTILEEEA